MAYRVEHNASKERLGTHMSSQLGERMVKTIQQAENVPCKTEPLKSNRSLNNSWMN